VNNSFFYTKVWVPKPDTGCTNYFESIDGFLFVRNQFIGLDENKTDHDYPDSKIHDAPPNFLKYSKASPKVKIMEEKGIGAHSLPHKLMG